MNRHHLRRALLLASVILAPAAPALAQVAGAINSPAANSTVMQPFAITGWAIHGGGVGTGIDIVRVYDCSSACILWGTATYGVARPDVAAAHGAQFLNSGYTFAKAGLAPGTYYLKVETHSTVTGAWYLYGHWFTAQAGPEHTLSVPTPGQAIPGALSVTGWAIDGSAPSGTGVSAISVWSHRNVGSGEPGVWHGFATYGGNRPDVVATHGERFRYSGYTGSFTLAAGAHDLGVSAQSSHTLVWTSQMRTVYVNMPTVPLTIDRPGTGTGGVTASGLSCPGGVATQALPCGATYPLHTPLTLTAVPDPGAAFDGWGGACTGTSTCVVTMANARFVTARFAKLPDTIATRYYHADTVGSIRAITDETGAEVIRHDYRPFGEDVQPLTGDPVRFAGKELDEETGMQYFDARYYRNTWGRFTTVDPLQVGAAMTDPQQWNRYAYARNNPLKWTDPTGLEAECAATFCSEVEYTGFRQMTWIGTGWCEEWWMNGAVYGLLNCTESDSGGREGGEIGGVSRTGGGRPKPVKVADSPQNTAPVPSSGTTSVVVGTEAEKQTMETTLVSVKRRIASRSSCGSLFAGGSATANGIINSTRYQFLNTGPAAWVPPDSSSVVYINRRGPFMSDGRSKPAGVVSAFNAPDLRDFMVIHETMHQANRLGQLALDVVFSSDSSTSDPSGDNQRNNNQLVAGSCFP